MERLGRHLALRLPAPRPGVEAGLGGGSGATFCKPAWSSRSVWRGAGLTGAGGGVVLTVGRSAGAGAALGGAAGRVSGAAGRCCTGAAEGCGASAAGSGGVTEVGGLGAVGAGIGTGAGELGERKVGGSMAREGPVSWSAGGTSASATAPLSCAASPGPAGASSGSSKKLTAKFKLSSPGDSGGHPSNRRPKISRPCRARASNNATVRRGFS